MNQPPEPSHDPAIAEAPSSSSQTEISVTEATPPASQNRSAVQMSSLKTSLSSHEHFLPFGWFSLGVLAVLKATRARYRKRVNGFQICSGTTGSSPNPKSLRSHCVPTLRSQSRPQQSWRKMAALNSSSPVWSLNKVD